MTTSEDILVNTFSSITTPDNRLKAIKMYAEGVKEDFPETAVWMNNILLLAGFEVLGTPEQFKARIR